MNTRTCPDCGWTGAYKTPGIADYALRRHSCDRTLAKTAARARGAARSAAVDRTPKPCNHKLATHQHGTYACYVLDACRCRPCATAQRAYEVNRVRQHAYGRWNGYIDAQPARDHVRMLMASGIGLKRIGELAGVAHGTLWKLIYGKRQPDGSQTPSRRIRPDTAQRLLALHPDPAHLAGGVIDHQHWPLAKLRLRSLVALGYSISNLGDRIGIDPTNMSAVICDDGRGMMRATVIKVDALFAELCMTPPAGTNRFERTAITRARKLAAERGWKLPLELPDLEIDSSDDEPFLDDVAIERRLAGDAVPLNRAEKIELAKRARARGISDGQIERDYGVNAHRYLGRQDGAA